ncbi:MAG: SPOR domain-containing protein [Acidobacteria bacterium]|nr:SPOR domain-containing protein [Acidobacteriota bacterium]
MKGDAYEPYEVAVSNSQIAAFVALLALALVGAFAAGVWWGRSNDLEPAVTEAAVTPPEVTLPQTVARPPAPVAADVESEEAPAEVVRFFGAGEDGAGPVETARPVSTPGPAASGLVVQVFSSADARQAASVEQKLRADGHRAFLSPQTLDGQVMQRVRVGPFEDQDSAAAAAELLTKQYGLETWITPNN